MKSREEMATTAAKLFLARKTKYTDKDLPKFSSDTLNEIIRLSKTNTPTAAAAANALAAKKNKQRG